MTRVAVAPILAENPYQRLLHDALAERGIAVEEPRLTLRWALRTQVGVLHLHWPEYLTGTHAQERLHLPKVALRLGRLLAVLLVLKARRVRIVWTVHNLRPHDERHRRLDLLVSRVLARLADRVVAHSEYAAAQIRSVYGIGSVTVAHHGTYRGWFPPAPDRAVARAELGLPPDAHVFLAFGLVRAYKRLPDLVAAFRELPQPDVRLVVAGRPVPLSESDALQRIAEGDPRITLLLDHIPDERVSELHAAADVAVLPYGDLFSSGALLLALTFDLPVVAPRGTSAEELVDPAALETFEGGGLRDALARTLRWDAGAARAAARATADRYPWSETADRLVGCYR